MGSFREGDIPMRIKRAIFVGSIATLAAMTAPALAKHSNAQKTDDQSTSSSCHAYQQAADGSWTELPCQELGSGSGEQTQHKSATRNPDEETRTR
jgi:hypothetical protein